MDPTKDEIEYARKQIEEANRRLENIHERVSLSGVKLVSTSDDSVGEITLQSTHFEDINESDIVSSLKEDGEEYEERSVNEVDKDLVASHIQNVIIDSQLSIELATKSMFKLTGKDYPFSHSISFDSGETKGFYHELPDEFDGKDKVVRVIFLTQFWGEFYELAKYGSPQLNVRPEMIFSINDGERAVNDAKFCIGVAQELLEFVLEDTSQ
jgi:HEPN domain-containing protein